MDIGNEIKQNTFPSNYSKAFINIIYTANKTIQSINSIFKPYGIQSQHFNVLRIINGKHPECVSPGYIKEVMLDKGRDLTRLLDKLEKSEWIIRHHNEDNRRKIDVSLTPKGIEMITFLSAKVDNWHESSKSLSEEESEQLSNLLDKFRG